MIAAETIIACHPQKVKGTNGPPNRRVWQVRCTT
ncbi:Uncharacterised protein [Vibrio cholerae]|nr:Uncharacterised protein [Vibrio cholerae]